MAERAFSILLREKISHRTPVPAKSVALQFPDRPLGHRALIRSKILAHAVDVKLYLPTSRAIVDVEGFLIHEKLSQISENPPAGAFMKFFGARIA